MTDKTALWYRCRDFVTEQSAGEWDDKAILEDTEKLERFVLAELNRYDDQKVIKCGDDLTDVMLQRRV